jgi:tRNA pseudouridine38-40 synthase
MHAVGLLKDGPLITFEISGDGFLYNMVRIMAGTLLLAGVGKISAGEVGDIISSGDRKRAGKTAPAQGLYLVEVYY